jgi:hypothetical protein
MQSEDETTHKEARMTTLAEGITSVRKEARSRIAPGSPERLVERIRAEFLEMPGLKLTLRQAGRVFGIDARQSECVLAALVAEGVLVRDAHGAFRRRS